MNSRPTAPRPLCYCPEKQFPTRESCQQTCFVSKSRLFQKRFANNVREPTFPCVCGLWQAIRRTPKIKKPSFWAKRVGGSENTCVFPVGHLFEKVCFSNFEGAEKERPESPEVIRAASISVAFREKTCFFRVLLRFRFRREM